jgi:hypothetical protein
MADDKIRRLGYEPTPRGWKRLGPPKCRDCGKRAGNPELDWRCEECFAGPGIVAYRITYALVDEPAPNVECRWCHGYLATGPDKLCDGCAWERSETTLTFSEWRELQERKTRELRRRAGKRRSQ